ncbi:MAG TPA: hypothetical protein VFA70_05135 [Dehalococcoidia bacterium]|nr:hypothetical protein [Dehalococcoidia bacterium]
MPASAGWTPLVATWMLVAATGSTPLAGAESKAFDWAATIGATAGRLLTAPVTGAGADRAPTALTTGVTGDVFTAAAPPGTVAAPAAGADSVAFRLTPAAACVTVETVRVTAAGGADVVAPAGACCRGGAATVCFAEAAALASAGA